MGKWKKSSQGLVDQFYSVLALFERHVEMRKMFGYPCSFVNGNMFTGLHEENWVLRLPETERKEITELGAKPFVAMGRTMKEYVLIPMQIRDQVKDLHYWIGKSLSFAEALPLKPKKR